MSEEDNDRRKKKKMDKKKIICLLVVALIVLLMLIGAVVGGVIAYAQYECNKIGKCTSSDCQDNAQFLTSSVTDIAISLPNVRDSWVYFTASTSLSKYIVVNATKKSSRKSVLEKFTKVFEVSGGKLELDFLYGGQTGETGVSLDYMAWVNILLGCPSLEIKITVPKGTKFNSVEITSLNANYIVKGLWASKLTMKTTAGKLFVQNKFNIDEILLTTTKGHITVDDGYSATTVDATASVIGHVNLRSINGSSISGDSAGTGNCIIDNCIGTSISCKTKKGTISVDTTQMKSNQGKLRVIALVGDIDVSRFGRGSITAIATTGNVVLDLAANYNSTIVASAKGSVNIPSGSRAFDKFTSTTSEIATGRCAAAGDCTGECTSTSAVSDCKTSYSTVTAEVSTKGDVDITVHKS